MPVAIQYFLTRFFWIFWIVPFAASGKTGYVDMTLAIKNTKQGARVTKRLEKELEQARKSIKSMEESLQKERDRLDKDMPLLSEEKRAQRIQEFQRRVMNSQRQIEAKKESLAKKEEKLMAPIIRKMERVIADTAKKEGFDMVQSKNKTILYVQPEYDLTAKVSARFNKK